MTTSGSTGNAIFTLLLIMGGIEGILWAIQEKMKKSDRLPDYFEKCVAYSIAFIFGFIACWRNHFSFFTFLGTVSYEHDFEGWIFTSFLLCAGRAYFMARLEIMNSVPYMLGNAYGQFRAGTSAVISANKTTMGSKVDTSTSQEVAPEPTDDGAITKTRI